MQAQAQAQEQAQARAQALTSPQSFRKQPRSQSCMGSRLHPCQLALTRTPEPTFAHTPDLGAMQKSINAWVASGGASYPVATAGEVDDVPAGDHAGEGPCPHLSPSVACASDCSCADMFLIVSLSSPLLYCWALTLFGLPHSFCCHPHYFPSSPLLYCWALTLFFCHLPS